MKKRKKRVVRGLKRVRVMNIEKGDILLVELAAGTELAANKELFKLFESRGVPVIVHYGEIIEFRIARKVGQEAICQKEK